MLYVQLFIAIGLYDVWTFKSLSFGSLRPRMEPTQIT